MALFPRIVLVIFLLCDVFYFECLEMFYKLVLLGILPFILRYVKYSIKDMTNQWILDLEEKYESVNIYEEGYRFDSSRINPDAIYHNEKKTIYEYTEIKFENYYDFLNNYVSFQYNAYPICSENLYKKTRQEKYNNTQRLTLEDYAAIHAKYYQLMPKILSLKQYLYRFHVINETRLIKWSRS